MKDSYYPTTVRLSPPEATRTYDAQGRVSTKAQGGKVTTYFYKHGRRVTATVTDGTTGRYIYYKNGLLKKSVWSDGEVRTVVYNKKTRQVIGVYRSNGARLAIQHDLKNQVAVLLTDANGARLDSTLLVQRVSEMVRHRKSAVRAVSLPGQNKVLDASGDCDSDCGGGGDAGGDYGGEGGNSDGGEGEDSGGGWDEAPGDGATSDGNAESEDENIPSVEVTGESCTTNPNQDACAEEGNGGDWEDASGDIPSETPGWHGPEGCPPTAIVERCKQDVYNAYEETVRTVCKKLLTASARQQCYAEQANLLADQLRQCEETLRCRDTP